MDTQIGYEQLQYAVWPVSYSNQIPSGYAQNRIWADSLNQALIRRFHAAAILKSKARLRWEETRK